MTLILIFLYIANGLYVFAELRRQDQEACKHEIALKQGISGQGDIPPEEQVSAVPVFEEPGPDLNTMLLGHIRRLLSHPD